MVLLPSGQNWEEWGETQKKGELAVRVRSDLVLDHEEEVVAPPAGVVAKTAVIDVIHRAVAVTSELVNTAASHY